MLIAVVPGESGGWRLRVLDEEGRPAGPVESVPELSAAVADRERAQASRWLWSSTAEIYPPLLRAGVRVARCHDAELTEALLLGCAGRWGEPRSVAAAWARARGLPVPEDPAPRPAAPPGDRQGALFDATPPPPAPAGFDPLAGLIEVYRLQRAAVAGAPAGRFRLLVAAESAGALVAAEMGHTGLPWRADIHHALLLDLLGEPSVLGGPPKRLAELSARIAEAFGVKGLHPERPAEVVRAFARAGVQVPNSRSWVLRRVDHPAVPLLLEFKELYRIWTAHGWAWCDAWVRDGRFRPEYVPAGVVSGRWATRGGGALQIPKVVRRAVVADRGWRFVVADAGQLEPRVLAAVSGDARFAAAGAAGDLYAALAADAFNGDRARAKLALLGAMYGQTGGAAVPALAALRGSYPTAFEYVESAARAGEGGGLVSSWLGRTCPPTSASWHDPVTLEGPPPEESAGGRSAAARARGRFTRNFVIQATAAEWALTLLAALRRELAPTPAELVFFQHDEVIVHCPAELAGAVSEAVRAAGEEARRLLFGATPVRFPLGVSSVECYADAVH
ncbi:bifunctional 3'-5' exonuclease/DNA polymerase [Rhizomonospora bruguierae]|uniref:bifunctional 3'-5' exonuclease/DNA polymerase n=1 Tax=Rhizomonospora bruguierae TaxID=1581705 RepID=UPI001BCDFFC5|nr:bifunctional 3'-5' exonuclease/DNA polymerase [Micromonospora sp. NBRC 107566]